VKLAWESGWPGHGGIAERARRELLATGKIVHKRAR
jgi:hypothetical protein